MCAVRSPRWLLLLLLLYSWCAIGTIPDYYKVLGLDKDASAKEIKKAFRTLAMQWSVCVSVCVCVCVCVCGGCVGSCSQHKCVCACVRPYVRPSVH